MTTKKYRDRSHSHDDDAAFTCEALTDEYAVVPVIRNFGRIQCSMLDALCSMLEARGSVPDV